MLMFTEDFPLTCRKLRLTTLNRIKGIPKNDNSGWLEMTMGNNSWQNWTTERKDSLLLTKNYFDLQLLWKKNNQGYNTWQRTFSKHKIDLDQHHSSKLIKSSYISSWFSLFSVFLSCILQKNLQQIGKSLMWIYFEIHFFGTILIAIKIFHWCLLQTFCSEW